MTEIIEWMIFQISSRSVAGIFCLVAVFFYVGLITIGGGLVAITVMQQILVERFNLISVDMFYNMVAISESTPGPMGINMATYVGTELYGVGGGIATTVGEVLPSIICIILIAKFFGAFSKKSGVKAAFSTLRPAVTGIIAVAAAKVLLLSLANLDGATFSNPTTWQNATLSFPNACFYLASLFVLSKTKIHPILIVVAGAVYGVFLC